MLKIPALATTVALLCAFIGFAIQIQMTIGQSAESFGLRINLGDFTLPFVGILVLGTLLIRKTIWPHWNIPLGLLWPIALSFLLCFAMWNGHRITGEWSQWAIINKFVGWFILMAYFVLGAWIATNFGKRSLKFLLKAFLLTSILVSSAHLIYILLADFGIIPPHFHYQLTGFMGNRNAMGLLIICTFALLIVPAVAKEYLVHPWIYRFYMALFPMIVIYNESRAVWAAVLIPVVGVLFLFRKHGLQALTLPAAALLVTLTLLTILDKTDATTRELRSGDVSVQHNGETIYAGDYQRLRVLFDSIEFWKEHPVTGIGLGTFIHKQDEKYADTETVALSIIDSSPLWVTVEFGMIGACLFCAFYILSLYTLKRTGGDCRNEAGPYEALRISMLLILLAFAAMSLFHELLYTRFIWLFLGMALAVSREELERVRANP